MKKWIAISLLAGSLFACGSKDSTQNLRDNETTVTAQDEVDNRPTPPDTLGTDTTGIK